MITYRNDGERQTESRRCSTCRKFKHLDQFSGKCFRCKICNREYMKWYRNTDGGRESHGEYNAKSGLRPILSDEARIESREAIRRRYRASELGKVTHHISVTRRRLRTPTPRSDKVRRTLARLLKRRAELRALRDKRK